MRVYLTDRDGVGIMRLHGTLGAEDARTLLRSIGGRGNGCFILDFEHVDHVDYRFFHQLAASPRGIELLLSGLSDYLIDIFAFAGRRRALPVYPSWRNAFRYLMAERGKLVPAAPGGAAGG